MSRARRLVCLAALAALVLVIPAGSAQASGLPASVMTRNLYLGADLTPAIAAQDLPGLVAANAGIWQTVQATDFPARAKVLAREIALLRPDLVGLQEAAMWRTGPFVGPGATATTVVYDFLASLQSELQALGARYDVAVQQEEADIQAPDTFPNFPSPAGATVKRLTQRDAILVRRSSAVSVTNPQSGHYATQLTLPTAGGPVVSRRGWTSVDATVRGNSFKFVNTHLEAFHPLVRQAQAAQLVGGPAAGAGPTVLVGDLNSDPDDTNPADALAYNVVAGPGGFADAAVQAGNPKPTSGHNETLTNPTANFTSRIDHIMTKGLDRPALFTTVTGDESFNRTPTGLWPSDHGGVYGLLRP